MNVYIIICMYVHGVQRKRFVVKPSDVCIWSKNVELVIEGQTKLHSARDLSESGAIEMKCKILCNRIMKLS